MSYGDLSTVHLDRSVYHREWSDINPSEPETIEFVGGRKLFNVHSFLMCQGHHCAIHNPSDHALSDHPLHWRDDKGIFERFCDHGIGHDDPDDVAYHKMIAQMHKDPSWGMGIHGCDGCCAGKYEEVQEGGGCITDMDNGTLRTFESGATRDTADTKPEPWGYTSALVEKAFSEYMLKHQVQSDGQKRPSNNWTKGIPVKVYKDSLSRHIQDLRLILEGYEHIARTSDLIETLCAIRFNVDGLIYETMKDEL